MAKIRDIQRTAAFVWSPEPAPFIATGTQAGAVSADFSDNTQLELWDLDLAGNLEAELSPVASVNTDSKFYDIAWGRLSNERPRGIIAGALESGSLDIWSADALLSGSDDPLVSRTTKHSGAIKSLQFNPFKPELLATAGARGELYVWDLDNTDNPFMLGNKAARADDFDCLDWNKKVPHILVTGGSGGFLTVWDVKSKKESLTLNNLGRKAVSAVAWHPEQQTKLITAIPDDTNPVILLWDLRNSNAPERTLSGHTAGVLSLSWCKQDIDLLLSCGKDNRTICWNPQSGEMLGEFSVVTNWTFKTSFHPRNPSYSATASYDGKIVVRTLQNTNPASAQADTPAAADADDFFSRASNAQTSSFSLRQTPKWMKRPAGAVFGFGGKLVSFSSTGPRQSVVKISTVAVDSGVTAATERFEKAVTEGSLVTVCDERVKDAKTEEEKSEWKILRTLFERDTKARIVELLGFNSEDISPEPGVAKVDAEETAGSKDKENQLSSFFDTSADSDSFLAGLSVQSTATARTNNPFKIYTGEESEAEQAITKAIVLGNFGKAVDISLKEDRISDAFMLAICGGDKCIERVRTAYFTKKAKGPNYLRLLASVVGKNLWDIVHNADLANWKETVVTLCTYATDKEFSDLAEALGDRLEEEYRAKGDVELRQNAALCYLAGSKLHKVVNIWIAELQEMERAGLQEKSEDSTFSVHARSLQQFIEKVTVFRHAVKFVDDQKNLTSGWKLNALYEKYTEYADVVASHGQLAVAGKYLDLLPAEYPAATVARNRIKQATQPVAPVQRTAQRAPATATAASNTFMPVQPAQPAQPQNPYTPAAASQPAKPSYVPPTRTTAQYGYQPAPSQYTPQYPGFGQPPTNQQPPPRTFSPAATAPPPRKQEQSTANWNDTPEIVRPSRRTTPAAPPQQTWHGAPQTTQSPPAAALPWGAPPKANPPPPPKGAQPPQRVQSPALRAGSPALSGAAVSPQPPANPYAPPPRPSSTTGGKYTPQAPPPTTASTGPLAGRLPGQSIPPPPTGATVTGRVPGSGPQYAPPPMPNANFAQPQAPSPYAPPSQSAPSPYAPPSTSGAYTPQAAPGPYAPPPSAAGPPPARPGSSSTTAPPPKPASPAPPAAPKYPKGDRSHIPPQYKAIYDLLSADMERVKARAPPSMSRQVVDVEKRLGKLFDLINNEELLSEETLQSLITLSQALANKDYATAHSIQVDLLTNKTAECATWNTGVKRLIDMCRVCDEQ